MMQAESKGRDWLVDQVYEYVKDILVNNLPPEGEEEKKQLEELIDSNFFDWFLEVQILNHVMNRGELEQSKKELLQTPKGIAEGMKKSSKMSRSQGLGITA